MTNGRKHGKHSAALPETQQTSARARETEARTGAMTNRELEEKFATKEELNQSEKFLAERIDHGFQLHSQELRSVETNLSQKIDANEKRAEDFRSDVNRQFEAIEARSVERTNASEARSVKRTNASEARIFDRLNEFKSDVYRQIQTMGKSLESTIEQQSEKNLYKTVFLVVAIGGSLSGLTYGVYQLVKFLIGGS